MTRTNNEKQSKIWKIEVIEKNLFALFAPSSKKCKKEICRKT